MGWLWRLKPDEKIGLAFELKTQIETELKRLGGGPASSHLDPRIKLFGEQVTELDKMLKAAAADYDFANKSAEELYKDLAELMEGCFKDIPRVEFDSPGPDERPHITEAARVATAVSNFISEGILSCKFT